MSFELTPQTIPAFRDALMLVTAVNDGQVDLDLMADLLTSIPPNRRVLIIAIFTGWFASSAERDPDGFADWTRNMGQVIAEAES